MLIASFYLKKEKFNAFEPFLIQMISILSMICLIMANDLIAIYLCIELQSFCFYLLAAIRRKNIYSLEAGIKYFILGSFSSSFLLFGISLVYGLTGLTNLEDLANLYSIFGSSNSELFELENYRYLLIGTIISSFFLVIGLSFKIYAAPFHFWIVDIYQGAPTFITAFFATVPSLSLFYLLIRFVVLFSTFHSSWYFTLLFFSISSMLFGTLGALYQKLIKKLIAYSAVGHVGYFLTLTLIFLKEGVFPVSFLFLYFIIYSLTGLGIFSIFLSLEKAEKSQSFFVEQMYFLSNLYKRNWLLALCMSVLLFSIAGIPPLPGFLTKLFLFTSVLHKSYRIFLFIYVMIIAVMSCFYYVRVVKLIYFSSNKDWFFFTPLSYLSTIILMVIMLLLTSFFFLPEYLQTYCYYFSIYIN